MKMRTRAPTGTQSYHYQAGAARQTGLSLRLVSGNVTHLPQTASALRYRDGESAALVVESPPGAANAPHSRPPAFTARANTRAKHTSTRTLICIATHTHTQFPLLMKRRVWFPLVVGALSNSARGQQEQLSLSTGPAFEPAVTTIFRASQCGAPRSSSRHGYLESCQIGRQVG